MPLYNPYREYDKGVDDAYTGKEPQSRNAQYAEGYNRAMQLEEEEQRRQEQKEYLISLCKNNQQPVGGGV